MKSLLLFFAAVNLVGSFLALWNGDLVESLLFIAQGWLILIYREVVGRPA